MPNMDPKKCPMPSQEPNVRNKNFKEVALVYTEEMAVNEAKRCLQCKNHPCRSGCPVEIDIPGFIKHVAEGDFEAAYNRGEPKVLEAMQVYVYNIVKYIGAYIAALGGVDAIVFTAGVGENSPIVRKLVLERLAYLGIKVDEAKNNERGDFAEITAPDSKVRAFVIPTNEELAIAQDTVNLTNN